VCEARDAADYDHREHQRATGKQPDRDAAPAFGAALGVHSALDAVLDMG